MKKWELGWFSKINFSYTVQVFAMLNWKMSEVQKCEKLKKIIWEWSKFATKCKNINPMIGFNDAVFGGLQWPSFNTLKFKTNFNNAEFEEL